jgi:hypothetical protein
MVYDRSGVGTAVDLTIGDPTAVSWLSGGGLSVNSATTISSGVVAAKLVDALTASGEVTLEAWVKPANITQRGPARIMALSQNAYPNGGNFVMGQERSIYDVRLRSTTTDTYGKPSLSSPTGSLTTGLTHVVFTRAVSGETKLYLNGALAASGTTAGDFSNWGDFALGLANEPTGARPWMGELHLVAVFDRALSEAEVSQNYLAGADSD